MQRIKIIVLVLVTFSLKGIAQESLLKKKVDITITNASIAEVFRILEDTYNFNFNYSNTSIDVDKKVSLDIKNEEILLVLRKLFPSKKYQFKEVNQKILVYKPNIRYVISGYVMEKGSGEALGSTSVFVPSLNIGTISNAYGFYSLSLPEGRYELLISSLGYTTMNKVISVTTDISLNFSLEAAPEFLNEVIITSENQSSKTEDVQMSSQKIKIATVNSLPTFFGESDVVKSMQLFPGVQTGTNGSTNLYVRGGTEDQNLILLDEATVYNHTHYSGFFSIFNGDAITSAELVKGGFSANYGGRLSSVLQIRTKSGNKEKFSGKFKIGILTSSLLLEGPIVKGKTSFVLSGRRTYPDLIYKGATEEEDRIDPVLGDSFVDLNFKIHHVFDDRDKIYWSTYYGSDSDEAIFGNTFGGELNFTWSNIISTLRWNHQISKKMFANTSLLYTNYRYKRVNMGGQLVNELEEPINIVDNLKTSIIDYGFKLEVDYYPVPNHSIKFGANTTYHDFVPRQVEREFGENIEEISFKQETRSLESAMYIQDEWEVTDRLKINAGMRFSHFQHKATSYFNPEGRLSVAYQLKPKMTIKGSYAKMSQYIHRLSNFGLGNPTDLWISSSENIDPQLSDQIALGLVNDLYNNQFSVEIEGFYKKLKDLISFNERIVLDGFGNPISNDQNFLEDITIGDGQAYGGEFLIRKNEGKLTGWLGYTYLKSERKFDGINQSQIFEQRYGRRHSFAIAGIYKPTKKWTLSTSWSFASGINYTLPVGIGISPVVNFPNGFESNPRTLVYISRNNFRGASSHRLDVGVQYHKKTKRKREITWGLSVYNVYVRANPDYYYISRSFDSNMESGLAVIGGSGYSIIPSLNYILKF